MRVSRLVTADRSTPPHLPATIQDSSPQFPHIFRASSFKLKLSFAAGTAHMQPSHRPARSAPRFPADIGPHSHVCSVIVQRRRGASCRVNGAATGNRDCSCSWAYGSGTPAVRAHEPFVFTSLPGQEDGGPSGFGCSEPDITAYSESRWSAGQGRVRSR